MKQEQRRITRVIEQLPIRLLLMDNNGGTILAGPAHGRLDNISPHGAGITVDKIFVDNHHLFYAPQDNSDQILYLEFVLPEEPDRNIRIPTRPIWFDRKEDEQVVSFIMGIEFVFIKGDDELKKIVKKVEEKHIESRSWLHKLLELIKNDKSNQQLPDEE